MGYRKCAVENMVSTLDKNFWRDKRVFITGHTGFKGSWLTLWLSLLEAEIIGFALQPPTTPNLFTLTRLTVDMTHLTGDIRDFDLLQQTIKQYQPDIIIHMAAQPLVRHSYHAPIETYATNVMGTLHLFEATKQIKKHHAIINVTTDKCYENSNQAQSFTESDRLGGHDPYSNSKACSELLTMAFRNSYSQNIASARAGNVIGGGDWAKDRLIPDIFDACLHEKNITIRYPHALRPWQHVLEPLHGYLLLAQQLYQKPKEFAEGWNFGPHAEDVKPVQWITEYILSQWNKNISWVQDSNTQLHEASYLTLNSEKAQNQLHWQPRWNLATALDETIQWYQAYQAKQDMKDFTIKQIKKFIDVQY